MDTPPNATNQRSNLMHFRRDDDRPNEMMMKFGSKYQLHKKEMTPPVNQEKEVVTKITNDLKKQGTFLETTKWMFENNSMLYSENYSAYPL